MNYTGALQLALNAYQLARNAAGNPPLYAATSSTQTQVQFTTLSQSQTEQVSTTQLTQTTSTEEMVNVSHRLTGVVILAFLIGILVIIMLRRKKADMNTPAAVDFARHRAENGVYSRAFCTSCGARLSPGAEICNKCGAHQR